ncbi:uncharacterized protein LOC113334640 [Papaver somniferum]|uniref:uncharacterized protein LOC113334640 n=1 Tax=Papaver somniferum TaxID=3469 RepID=UPI000E6FCA58|nr:uncharacterized protein LOC113334640 [Papaver somniferum]
MDVHRIKQENELRMQPPPGFAPRFSNGQGNAQGTSAGICNDYDRFHSRTVGLQENINPQDEKADRCNKNAKEVAADDDDLGEQGPETDSRIIELADPEFYDFDRDRTEECLAADQIWAIHDDLDAMPRLYALIRKVYTPFEVKIIWLDFVSDDRDETACDTSELPIACGKFEHGDTDTLEVIGAFSHRIVCEKDGRNTYKIYLRKGEIWALWNTTWNSDSNNHRPNEYEFVEVLSDYTQDTGISVAYLVKIRGFVCLFKPVTMNDSMAIIQIPSDELLRFSQMVPSFRTTGKEREDVPEGYFELDPASLPSILHEVPDNVVVAERIPTSVPSSTTKPCEDPESEFYVFGVDKSHDKFQTDQVWALYDELHSLPKYYARINKVESYPKFKVHIQWLEACTPPKGVIQWLDNKMPTCCGIFSSGETMEFYETARFSHLAKGAVARTRNKYEIYPRKGEVWAIFREFSSNCLLLTSKRASMK